MVLFYSSPIPAPTPIKKNLIWENGCFLTSENLLCQVLSPYCPWKLSYGNDTKGNWSIRRLISLRLSYRHALLNGSLWTLLKLRWIWKVLWWLSVRGLWFLDPLSRLRRLWLLTMVVLKWLRITRTILSQSSGGLCSRGKPSWRWERPPLMFSTSGWVFSQDETLPAYWNRSPPLRRWSWLSPMMTCTSLRGIRGRLHNPLFKLNLLQNPTPTLLLLGGFVGVSHHQTPPREVSQGSIDPDTNPSFLLGIFKMTLNCLCVPMLWSLSTTLFHWLSSLIWTR